MRNSSTQEKALNVILVVAVVLLLPGIVKKGYSRAHLFIFIYTILMQPQNRKNRQLRLKKLRKGKASLLNMSVRAALHSVLDDKLFVQQKILWLQDAPAAVRRARHTFSP